jgi:hypothetical protein
VVRCRGGRAGRGGEVERRETEEGKGGKGEMIGVCVNEAKNEGNKGKGSEGGCSLVPLTRGWGKDGLQLACV